MIVLSFMLINQSLLAQFGSMAPQTAMQSQTTISYLNYNVETISFGEINPDEYIVGSGDNFLIQINHLSTITYTIDVSPIGDIMIPSIGQVHVSELTFQEAVKVIREKCKQQLSSAEVDVNLNKVRNVKIPVFGAVQNSEMITLYTGSDVNNITESMVRTPITAGTIQRKEMASQTANGEYVLPASLRLHDLLSVLSLHYLAKDFAIEVHTKDDTSVVNIYKYYMNGEIEHNPYLFNIKSIYIPFSDIETECIEVYGPINTKAIVPIIPGETVNNFIQRKIQLTSISNYDAITLKRDNKILLDRTNSYKEQEIKLMPGDILEVSSVKRIMVNGFVNTPGIYNFIQGHTVSDYIAMAGGVDSKGSNKKAVILRDNKKIKNTEGALVERGDIIIVNRSTDNIFFGEISVLEFLSMLASITLTFIAAYNSLQ